MAKILEVGEFDDKRVMRPTLEVKTDSKTAFHDTTKKVGQWHVVFDKTKLFLAIEHSGVTTCKRQFMEVYKTEEEVEARVKEMGFEMPVDEDLYGE